MCHRFVDLLWWLSVERGCSHRLSRAEHYSSKDTGTLVGLSITRTLNALE